MKNLISVFTILSIALTMACKKSPVCAPAFTDEECKELQHRSYPVMDVSSDPAAWYKATIEGRPTSVGTGMEDDGIYHFNGLTSMFRTTEPTLDPSAAKSFDLYALQFWLYKPKGFVGQQLGLLTIRSPQFDKDTIVNLERFMDTLLAVGPKQVDDGTEPGLGWDITMMIYSKIEYATQTDYGGMPLFTSVANQPVPFNSFEITRLEKEDIGGGMIRYTFWCSFQAELYRFWGNKPLGQYFGKIEDGEGKFYIDVKR